MVDEEAGRRPQPRGKGQLHSRDQRVVLESMVGILARSTGLNTPCKVEHAIDGALALNVNRYLEAGSMEAYGE